MRILTTSVSFAVLCTLLGSGSATAQEQHAHVHGLAYLNLAIEGKSVSMELTATAYDLVGFERAARDDAERSRLTEVRKSLLNHAALWQFTVAAGCVAQPPVLQVPGANGHDHDHAEHDHGNHSDWQVSYRFECQNPQALRSITVSVFKQFPSLETIQVQLLNTAGASALTLQASNPRIALTP